MSAVPKHFVLGPVEEPMIEESISEWDELPDDVAVHCSKALMDQLMDHAVKYRHTEVFGLLLGRAVRTPARKTRTIVLDFLAAERLAASSLTFVEVSAQELIRLDNVHEASPDKKDLRKVGWFHTHPGHGIFMSSTDRANHAMYSNPWQVALVLDPIHVAFGFFAGTECKPIPLAHDGSSSVSKQPLELENHNVKRKKVRKRSTNWLLVLVAALAVTQSVSAVVAFRAQTQVTELHGIVLKQQQRLDALDNRVRLLSSADMAPIEEPATQPDSSVGRQIKGKE